MLVYRVESSRGGKRLDLCFYELVLPGSAALSSILSTRPGLVLRIDLPPLLAHDPCGMADRVVRIILGPAPVP